MNPKSFGKANHEKTVLTTPKEVKYFWNHITAVCLVIFVSLLVYSNTLHSTFHFDDVPLIVENHEIKNINNISEILMGQRGVSMASFALNYAAGGLDVFGYHLVNIFIHITNGALVYFILFFTLKPMESKISSDRQRHSKIALYSSLIFAVHPIQTQAVTYIVQRMETLASMFYLLAILLFIRGAAASRIASKILLQSGVVICYLLGFKSKEITITLPAIILLYDVHFISKGKVRELLKRWPIYAVLSIILYYLSSKILFPAGMLSTANSVISGSGFNDVRESTVGFGVKEITPSQYLYTQFNVIFTYLRLLILPVKQSLDYDYPVSKTLFELPTLLSFIGVVAILTSAFYLLVKPVSRFTIQGRVISFFIFWFFTILSPTSSFVPIQDVIFEHRLYLASVGFIVIFVILLDENVRRLNNGGKN